MSFDELKEDLQKHCDACVRMLEQNTEWIERYNNYLTAINNSGLKDLSKDFIIKEPFSKYSSISKAGKLEYDIRLYGRSIARVYFNKDANSWFLNTINQKKVNSNYTVLVENNQDLFNGKEEELDILKQVLDHPWDSVEAHKFRSLLTYIGNNAENLKYKMRGPEHFLENGLLKKFSKNGSCDKKYRHISPVTINDVYFQMPTPFKASKGGQPKYSGSKGGGIDILSRIRVSDKSMSGDQRESQLCIMELKDENKESENYCHVLKQALTYATFIARLLREDSCCQDYWNFFKPNTHAKLSKSRTLDLYAVCLMPQCDKEETLPEPIIFLNETLNVKFHLHSLYFNPSEDWKHFNGFSGTLPQIMKK